MMPPFSQHAGHHNWEGIEDFYNPMGVFDEVLIACPNETDRSLPTRVGSLRLFPIYDELPRSWSFLLGSRAYARLDPVVAKVIGLARENDVDLVAQRYGSPLYHGLPAVWAAAQIGCRSIITFQSDYEARLLWEFNRNQRFRRRVLDYIPWRFLVHNATVIWTVSDFVRKVAVRRGASDRKLVTIPNKDRIRRLGDPIPAPTCEETLDRLGLQMLKDRCPVFLSVGRFIRAKNYSRMLTAFGALTKHYPEAIYVIVGQGPGEEAVQRQIERDRIGGHVRVIRDYLTLSQLRVLYDQADALVFCSLYEGQPRVPYEAMACGTPVVGSDIEPVADIVRRGRTGILIDPLSVDSIANGLTSIAGGALPKEIVSSSCRETALRFDVARINPLEAALYRRILAGSFD